MRSYTDLMTNEKVYEYVCPYGSDCYGGDDGKYFAHDMQYVNGRFAPLSGTKVYSPFDSMKIRYPHYFRKEDSSGIMHDYIFGLNGENKLVYFDLDSPSSVQMTDDDVTYSTEPVFIDYNFNGKDYLIINGKDSGFFVYDGNFKEASENPLVTGAAVFDNKLFACSTENYPRVKYMTPSDPTSWSNNFASLSVYNECGMARNLATLKNYIYVFQENGISRIARADTENYSVAKIWQSGEKIYGETVKVVNNEAWFFSSAGLCRFDGSNVKRISPFPEGMRIGGEASRIEVFGDKVYVTTALGKTSEKMPLQNDTLIVFDGQTGEAAVYRDVNVRSFCALRARDEFMLAFADDSVAFIGGADPISGENRCGEYTLEETDFGISGEKNVSFVKIRVTSNATVRIIADGKESVYDVTAKRRSQFLRINKRGEKFSLTVSTVGGEMFAPVIYFSEAKRNVG